MARTVGRSGGSGTGPGEEDATGSLTHLDSSGKASMVDVGDKPESARRAVARGSVVMSRSTLELVRAGAVGKGEVLAVARVAGIMAAKGVWAVVPLAHPLLTTHVAIRFREVEEASRCAIEVEAEVETRARTGAELEALYAVEVALLTIYDMCKSADRGMKLTDIRLVHKSGGKSGTYVREGEEAWQGA